MRYTIIAASLIYSVFCGAQNHFQGTVIYEQKESSEDFKNQVLNDPEMDPKMKAFLVSKMQQTINKTFELQFDQYASVYKEQEKISIKNNEGNASWSPSGLNIAIYKNLKPRTVITTKDLMGKYYNIADSLRDFHWKLQPDTKQIGDYKCNKAIAIIPVSALEKSNYENQLAAQAQNKTQFFDAIQPKEKTVTAWYTTEVPISQGPNEYWGLPGLILEIDEGKTTVVCSKLVLNAKEKTRIKLSQKAKLVSQAEFNQIAEKKRKEFEDSNYKLGD